MRGGLHRRVTRGRFSGGGAGRLRLGIVPLIDVVFLLLAFFLLTANFRPAEGFVPASVARGQGQPAGEVEPLEVEVTAGGQGQCEVRIGGERQVVMEAERPGEGLVAMGEAMLATLEQQGRRAEDPVRLRVAAAVPWEQVVRVYDVMWRLGMSQVVFVMEGGQ